MTKQQRDLLDEGIGKIAAVGCQLANDPNGSVLDQSFGRVLWRSSVKLSEMLDHWDHGSLRES